MVQSCAIQDDFDIYYVCTLTTSMEINRPPHPDQLAYTQSFGATKDPKVSYPNSNGHSNENCYQQQQSGKRRCTYHKSASHSDEQCYHQRNDSCISSADSKSTKDETFVAGNNDVTGCEKCSCNGKVDDKPKNTPPGIEFSFAMCHPPLPQEADGFQLLVDSESSKHLIDTELIRGVESRMQEYTRVEPPMGIIAAGNNVLRGTAQGILLVVVRGADDALRTVKLPL